MYTVIFADDEEDLRKAIIQKIDWNSIGFEVIGEAGNGAEALELVEALGQIRDKLDERFARLKNGVMDGDFSERERCLEAAAFLLPLLMDQAEPVQDLSQEKKLQLE